MAKAWLVSFIRILLLFITLAIFYFSLQATGLEANFPFLPDLATIYFTIANISSFFLLNEILKKEGRSIRDLIGFERERLGKDILFGFLWLFVLFIPFVLLVMAAMFLLYGSDFINQFEAVFAGNIEIWQGRRGCYGSQQLFLYCSLS